MNNSCLYKILFSAMVLIGSLFFISPAIADMPEAAVMLDWNKKLKTYTSGMTVIEQEIRDSIYELSAPESAPDRVIASMEIEKKLAVLDAPTRTEVIELFIKAIQRHFKSGDKALKDTGGTQSTDPGYRFGFGDFDLEAPEKNLPFIKKVLMRMVPAETIEDHGSYIEVKQLRLIVFKRRPIHTLADLEQYSDEKLLRATYDKEVYLHLRLPPPSSKNNDIDNAYRKLVSALEIQGHIKKGIQGALVDPYHFFKVPDGLEELQSFAKSALKSIKTLEKTMTDSEVEQEINDILKSVGFKQAMLGKDSPTKTGYIGFRSQLRGLKSWGYLNPYLYRLTPENVTVFQKAVRGVLDMADKKSRQMAAQALKTLEELQQKQPADPKLEKLIIAARLFKKQQQVNQAKLQGQPAEESVASLLALFNLGENYEIQQGSGSTPAIITPRWSESGSAIQSGVSGRSYAIATWRSYDPLEKTGWYQNKASQRETITIAITEYHSEQEAERVQQAMISLNLIKQEENKYKQKNAAAKSTGNSELTVKKYPNPRGAMMPWLDSLTVIKELDYQGGQSYTEHLGTSHEALSLDFSNKKAALVSYLKSSPIIRTLDVTTAERLTSDEEIVRRKKNAQEKKNSIPQTAFEKALHKYSSSKISAEFKVRTESVSAVTNPGIPLNEQKQGVVRFGRFVIIIERVNSYQHVSKTDSSNNTRLISDLSSTGEWSKIEETFYKLAERKSPVQINIVLRLDDPDIIFSGIAADGISELGIVVDLSGSESSLAQIDSVKLEVVDVPGSAQAGVFKGEAQLQVINKNRQRLFARFKAPDFVPREHKQKVRLLILLKDGNPIISRPLNIMVAPAPIVMIHGIWSNYQSMVPLREFLIGNGLTTRSRCRMVLYGDSSYKSLLPNARRVRNDINDLLMQINREGIKTARVNIVAHSLGGLLARIVILGRKDLSLPGDGDKVAKLITLATPHQGSALADWYADYKPDTFTDETDPSLQDFTDLRTHVRTLLDIKAWAEESSKSEHNIFEFGSAVLALRTTPNRFLDQLNYRQRTPGLHQHIEYFLVAGTESFISRDYADVAAVLLYNGTRAIDLIAIRNQADLAEAAGLDYAKTLLYIKTWPISLAKYTYAGLKSQKFKQMIAELMNMISMPDGDGVVLINSANPRTLFPGQIRGMLEVPANHFEVVTNLTAMSKVKEWLVGEKRK